MFLIVPDMCEVFNNIRLVHMKLLFFQVKYGRKLTVFYSSNCTSSTIITFNVVIVAVLSLPTLKGVYQLAIAVGKKHVKIWRDKTMILSFFMSLLSSWVVLLF